MLQFLRLADFRRRVSTRVLAGVVASTFLVIGTAAANGQERGKGRTMRPASTNELRQLETRMREFYRNLRSVSFTVEAFAEDADGQRIAGEHQETVFVAREWPWRMLVERKQGGKLIASVTSNRKHITIYRPDEQEYVIHLTRGFTYGVGIPGSPRSWNRIWHDSPAGKALDGLCGSYAGLLGNLLDNPHGAPVFFPPGARLCAPVPADRQRVARVAWVDNNNLFETQVWVDRSGPPFIRRYNLAALPLKDTEKEGRVVFAFRDWAVDVEFPPETFEFVPPPGTQQVERFSKKAYRPRTASRPKKTGLIPQGPESRGQVYVGSRVEMELSARQYGVRLAGVEARVQPPPFLRVIDVECDASSYFEGCPVRWSVRCDVVTDEPGEFQGDVEMFVGGERAAIPVSVTVLPHDPEAIRMLVVDFDGHQAWLDVVRRARLNVDYRDAQAGYGGLASMELDGYAVVLFSKAGLIRMDPRDEAKLRRFVEGGGRLIIPAGTTYCETASQANRILKRYGLEVLDEEPKKYAKELGPACVVPDLVVQGIRKLRCHRPSPIAIHNDEARILVSSPPYPGHAYVAAARAGKGTVVAIGQPLWDDWIGDKDGVRFDNALLLQKLVTGRFGTRLLLWNQHISEERYRGTKSCVVLLYSGRREVWRTDVPTLEWLPTRAAKTVVDLPSTQFDRIRVEVRDWVGAGGGFSEIQVMRGEKNVALHKPVKASASYSKSCAPSALTDGITTSLEAKKGYWLLPDQQKGWIEIDLSGGAEE